MPTFTYRARDKDGALHTGTLDGETRMAIEGDLDAMGLIPLRITSVREPLLPQLSKKIAVLFSPTSDEDLILFSRQLATLTGAGVPLTKALTTLEKQMSSPYFVNVIKEVKFNIEGGGSFHKALAEHPEVFPEVFIHMVEAGEVGGILDEVLDRMADMFEMVFENKAKVRSAMLYPVLVITALAIAVVVVMTSVVPKFSQLYSNFNAPLPWATRLLIAFSNLFTTYWYVPIAVIVALYTAYFFYIRTESGRYNVDNFRLKIPVFGPLLLKATLARMTRVLGALQRTGLPILHSLDVVSRSVENKVISTTILDIKEEVRGGKNISEPMEDSWLFPPLVVQMVAIGEETGELDDMLGKVADYYDQQVNTTIRNLTTLLEPMLLVLIFGVVLILALAIFTPMWDLITVIKR